MDVLKRIGDAGLVPVVVIDDAQHAVPAARALMEAGLTVMEITMRTAQGLQAIRDIRAQVPEMLVGAGMVLSIKQASQASQAGAARPTWWYRSRTTAWTPRLRRRCPRARSATHAFVNCAGLAWIRR